MAMIVVATGFIVGEPELPMTFAEGWATRKNDQEKVLALVLTTW
jgi:hypothetical protein